MENNFDFVIIGTGPAGSTISKFLCEKKFKIALVDRASDKNKGRKSFIFNPYVDKCPKYYSPSFSDQLGGNSALWHKKIYLISKDEITKGKWPLKYSEILKYSKLLANKLGIKHSDLIYPNKKKNTLFKFSQSIRANFSNLYDHFDLRSKYNVKTFKNSSPIKLFHKKNKKISGVEIFNSQERKIIKLNISKALVFCAGGLGNSFLIKNLIKDLGKQSGQFFCDHPHIQILKLNTSTAKNFKKYSKVFIFSDQKSKKNKNKEWNMYMNIKNHFAGIQLTTNLDPTLILGRLYLKTNFFNLLGSPYRFAKNIIKFIIFVVNLLFKVYYKIIDKIGKPGKYSFEFFFSQQKNYSNNLKINKKKDKFGLNKIDINWSIDKRELSIYNKIIHKFINSTKPLKNKKINIKNFEKKVYVGIHPSCANSFGISKKFILDKNLKIKQFKNLYVCGSDVFPSNGFTNPTWTIMTLGTRLFHHLTKKFN